MESDCMAIEYLACGNIMSDQIMDVDGNLSESNMGGPAFYALAGMRLWTPNCKLVCKAGADYADSYGKWMDNNGVSRDSVQVAMENCSAFILKYNKDGSFEYTSKYSAEHLGYLKTHPEDIDKAAEGETIKGMYMAHNMDPVIWQKLGEVKRKHGFKIMWEIEYAKKLRDMMGWSRETVRKKLSKVFCFYRVGERGAYAVTPTDAYFCEVLMPFGPSVDPTGCGNNSTGTAMYSYVAGDHPAMVAVKACISAGFNASQRGPYPVYTEESRAFAQKLAKEQFEKVMNAHRA